MRVTRRLSSGWPRAYSRNLEDVVPDVVERTHVALLVLVGCVGAAGTAAAAAHAADCAMEEVCAERCAAAMAIGKVGSEDADHGCLVQRQCLLLLFPAHPDRRQGPRRRDPALISITASLWPVYDRTSHTAHHWLAVCAL